MPKNNEQYEIKYELPDFVREYPVYNNCLNILSALVALLDHDIESNSKEVIEPFETSLKEYLEDVLTYASDDVQSFIDELNGELKEDE